MKITIDSIEKDITFALDDAKNIIALEGANPWCKVTTHLPGIELPNYDFFLDTNNCSKEILDYLAQFYTSVEEIVCGHCTYRLVTFNKKFIDEMPWMDF